MASNAGRREPNGESTPRAGIPPAARNDKTGLVAILAVLLLVACGGTAAPAGGSANVAAQPATSANWTPELRQVIDAAKKEGALQLVWSESTFGGSQGAAQIQSAMNQMF